MTDGILTDTKSYSLAVDVAPVGSACMITASAGSGGSITPSGAESVTKNGTQTFSIMPNTGYSISFVIVDGTDQGPISSYTFTNVTDGHTISVIFSYTGGGTGSPEPTYISRALTDNSTGIKVSGNGIHKNAVLTVRDMALHPAGDAACDAIRAAQANGQLTLGFDIGLTRGFTGEVTVTIPVGNQYNGQTVDLLHCVNGRLETLTAMVVNEKAAFTVTELSPFAVVRGLLIPDSVVTDPPKTGDGGSAWTWWLLCSVSAMSIVALVVLGKRRRPYKR